MIRTRAALLHLLISATFVGPVLAVVFFAWYPGFLFEMVGAITPVLLLIGVNVTLGPLLTFIVYKPGKRGLKFDLWFIATVQIVALVFGTITLQNGRPHFFVFAKDSFAAVPAQLVDMSALRYEELATKPFVGPVHVFARIPTDPAELNALLESVMFEGKPDLERRPEFFEPYENGAETVRSSALPLEDFAPANPAEEAEVARLSERFPDTPLLIVPARTLEDDFSILLDAATLEPVAAIRANSWRR